MIYFILGYFEPTFHYLFLAKVQKPYFWPFLPKIGQISFPEKSRSSVGNLKIRPKNLKNIIKTAEKLADGLQFVRVDLYILNGTIFGGEMTFSPAGGHGKFLTKRCSDKFVKYFDGTTTTSDQFNLPMLCRTI